MEKASQFEKEKPLTIDAAHTVPQKVHLSYNVKVLHGYISLWAW